VADAIIGVSLRFLDDVSVPWPPNRRGNCLVIQKITRQKCASLKPVIVFLAFVVGKL